MINYFPKTKNTIQPPIGATHVMPDGTTMLNSDMTGAMSEIPQDVEMTKMQERLPEGFIIEEREGNDLSNLPEGFKLEDSTDSVEDIGAFRGFLEGSNVRAAKILGAPADISNYMIDIGRDALGLSELGEPFFGGPSGGSGTIEEAFQSAGITTGIPFDDLSENAKLGYVAGDTAMSTIPFAAAPFLAASRVGLSSPALSLGTPTGPVQTIVNTAASNPAAFAITEAGSTTGASQGAAIAEALAPSNPLARVSGEIAGGLLNPVGLIGRFIGTTSRGAIDFVKGQFRSGREAKAAKILQESLVEAGENPEAVIRALEAPSTLKLTSGQKTGSPTMLAFESRLASQNSKFSGVPKERADEAFSDMRKQIDNILSSGQPESFQLAVKAREQYFSDLINQRISAAQIQAANAVSKISRGGSVKGASLDARSAVSGALKEARGVESSLWEKIPKNINVTSMNGLSSSYAKIKDRLLAEEVIPFDQSINSILSSGGTTGDFIRLRSRLMAKARTLRASRDFDSADIHDTLAQGALDDLDKMDIPVAQEARDFSRMLHDQFSRSFAKSASATDATGATRTPPEILLERAFGAGGTKGEVQFKDLQRAADFGDRAAALRHSLADETPPIGSMFGADVANAQERFLSKLAQEAAPGGVINPTKLNRFIEKNKDVLSRFPELKADISNAADAQRSLAQTELLGRQASQAVAKRAVFSKIANLENPIASVNKVLSGPRPFEQYGQLSRLAKSGGRSALDGLRTSTLSALINRSRGAQGVDFNKLSDALSQPIGGNGQNILNTMIEGGIISRTQSSAFKDIIEQANQLTLALSRGRSLDEIQSPDALFDLVVRIAGAKVGAAGAAGTTGASIVAAGAGSRFARNIFQKVPASKVGDVLIEAADNPKFAAALLRRAPTLKAKKALNRQINGFLWQAGLISKEQKDQEP